MDLGNILRTLGRRSLLILAFTVFGVAVAGWFQLDLTAQGLVPKAGKYRAQTRLLIDLPNVDADVAAQSVFRLVLTPAQHAEVVKTQAFSEEVSRRVGGKYTPKEIQDTIAAFGVLPSQVITISVGGDSVDDAVNLSKASAATYIDWLNSRQDNAFVPEKNRLVATVLEQQRPEDVTTELENVNKWLTFGGIVGCTLGVVLAFGMAPPTPKRKVVRIGGDAPDGVLDRVKAIVPGRRGEDTASSPSDPSAPQAAPQQPAQQQPAPQQQPQSAPQFATVGATPPSTPAPTSAPAAPPAPAPAPSPTPTVAPVPPVSWSPPADPVAPQPPTVPVAPAPPDYPEERPR